MALAAVFALAMTGFAEARAGGGKGGFGSRGQRTFDAPAATRTAPAPAAPMQRTQAPAPQAQPRATAPAPTAAAQPRRFGTGFMAGLLGAGLLGALFGAGLFGGLGSLASILGFVLQVALIAGAIYLVVRLFRRRQEPAYAAPTGHADSGPAPTGPTGPTGPMGRSALGGLGGLAGAARAEPQPAAPIQRERSDEVGIGPEDYGAFERLLHEVQGAYGRQDVEALWRIATPEMAGYLQEEINDAAREGRISKVEDVRLLQGDLAEAWREGESAYATVAMRFSLVEAVIERATGRVVSGDPTRPVEVTEIWTFRRDGAAPWKLSAIQPVE